MAKILKELKGHSNSQVLLLQENDKVFVRKTGDISRNMERYDALSRTHLRIPKIINYYGNSYDMEYIPNLDIKSYLSKNSVGALSEYLVDLMDFFAEKSIEMDFLPVYEKKLNHFPFYRYDLPFTKEQLISKLPQYLPFSEYHGDLTLENVLYDVKDGHFVLIDPITTEYSSYVFDLAKLRQDLTCGWFIRNDNLYYESKLKVISEHLSKFVHFSNDYLLILMLMRVLPYTQNKDDEEFLISEIKRLWK